MLRPFDPLASRARRVGILLGLAFALGVPGVASALTVTIPAQQDNTLYESATGATSNGAGEYVFTGLTKDGLIRRGVIQFDIAGNVPAGAAITGVTLQLHVSRVANNTFRFTTLHRLTASWGEGASNAGQNEGQGAPSTTNDATWIHRFHPGTLWTAAGGDFIGAASATVGISGNGTYAWTGPGLVLDVQGWLDTPAGNFGWLVRGDESAPETAKRLDSRENGQLALRPALVVDYTLGAGTGACCLPTGDCSIVSATQCAAQGGTYQGDGTNCTPNPCGITVNLPAAQDNTLYESATGALSNGAGTKLLASKNSGGLLRRGLVRFDVSSIPAGSTIQSATLSLHNVEATNSATLSLHRVLAQWGEGTSVATGTEDAGAAPTNDDATWIHRFFPGTSWTSAGGDFATTATVSTAVVGAGTYQWSGAALVADVDAWVNGSATNAGWVLRGKETGAGNALKRFESRQSPDVAHRPRLDVTYVPPVVAPTGACCLPSGVCAVHSAADCAAEGGTYQGDDIPCTGLDCPVVLTPFVDPLPIPAVAQPVTGTPGGAAEYVIPVQEVSQQLHRDLPPTRVWGYGGTYPGPTILATSGVPITVTWQNDIRDEQGVLRTSHYLPVDLCMKGPDTEGASPRIVTHLHGGHVPAESDGYPESTFLPGQQATYVYPNNQSPGTPWYHDHAMGITRLNVMMGMAGFYLIGDAFETSLGLPSGEYELGLAIQDRQFNPDGSLRYPATWADHFEGDKMLVNGKVWPYLQVKQGKYRFRLLNGCNSRFLGLALSNGAPFTVIGTDLGLLPAPVNRTHLLLAPGERQDVIVDFAAYPAGTQILLTNDAPAMHPGEPGVGVIPNVMRFDVVAATGHVAPVPAALREVPPIDTTESVLTRDFSLKKGPEACAGSMWTINDLHWEDITEYPVLGTTEIWRFLNESGMSHPMHMHLVQFQIVDRRPFTRVGGQIVFTGPPVPPDPAEAGWKDTAPVGPGEMLRVIARFEDYVGPYAYHCHMLEHEDHEMMRQFQTVPAPFAAVRDTTYQETSEAGSASFAVTLSTPVQTEVRVIATTEDGTAVAGLDYVATTDTLVFAPGVTSLWFEVPMLDDSQPEGTEQFTVRLTATVHAALGDSVALCTILDNEEVTDAPLDIPATSYLRSGVPNPFRVNAAIEWGLSTTTRVELSVFDVQGRRIRRLVAGTQPAGRHRTGWDGLDEAGRHVPSGLYIARLDVGTQEYRSTLLRIR